MPNISLNLPLSNLCYHNFQSTVYCTTPYHPIKGISYHTSLISVYRIILYRHQIRYLMPCWHTNTIIEWYLYGIRYRDSKPCFKQPTHYFSIEKFFIDLQILLAIVNSNYSVDITTEQHKGLSKNPKTKVFKYLRQSHWSRSSSFGQIGSNS